MGFVYNGIVLIIKKEKLIQMRFKSIKISENGFNNNNLYVYNLYKVFKVY